jgi:hypothetical protein
MEQRIKDWYAGVRPVSQYDPVDHYYARTMGRNEREAVRQLIEDLGGLKGIFGRNTLLTWQKKMSTNRIVLRSPSASPELREERLKSYRRIVEGYRSMRFSAPQRLPGSAYPFGVEPNTRFVEYSTEFQGALKAGYKFPHRLETDMSYRDFRALFNMVKARKPLALWTCEHNLNDADFRAAEDRPTIFAFEDEADFRAVDLELRMIRTKRKLYS